MGIVDIKKLKSQARKDIKIQEREQGFRNGKLVNDMVYKLFILNSLEYELICLRDAGKNISDEIEKVKMEIEKINSKHKDYEY